MEETKNKLVGTFINNKNKEQQSVAPILINIRRVNGKKRKNFRIY